MFIFIGLTFYILGRFVKSGKSLLIFRSGIVLYLFYVLLVSLLKEKIVDYYLCLGSFYGFIQGLFWVSGHTLINRYAGNDSKNFVSIRSMISKTLKILFPIVFGVSIELTSFSYIARIVVVISFIQFCFSLLIKDTEVSKNKQYSLKEYLQYLMKLKDKKINNVFKLVCLDGIVSYLLETIVTILIVMNFKTSISLGFLTTIFSVFSIISIFIFNNRMKNRKLIFKICSVFIIIGVCALLFDINKISVIIYNLCNSIFLVLLVNNCEHIRYNSICNNKIIMEDYMEEHQVYVEVLLNITRVLAYVVLFVASLFNNMVVFKILLILITIAIIIYSKIQQSYEG